MESAFLELEILDSKEKGIWVEIFNGYIEFNGKPSFVSIILLGCSKRKDVFNDV